MLCRYLLGMGLLVAARTAAANAKDVALVANKSNGVTDVSMSRMPALRNG